MKRKQYPGGTTTAMRYADGVLAKVECRDAGGEAKYEIAISSETIVERSMWGLAWREQLDHSPGAVQLSRFKSGRAAFLADHDDNVQIGTLRNARVDEDRVTRAEVVWGVSAKALERKAEIDAGTGVGANVSVGYIPKQWKLIEEDSEAGDLWIAKLWEPVEASSVSIPADPSVGFGRSKDGPALYPVETEEERTMKKKVLDERGQVIEVDEEDPRPAYTGRGSETPKRDRDHEMIEIMELSEGYGIPLKREWVERKLTPDQVAREMLKERATKGAVQPASEIAVDLPDRDAVTFSYARAILIAAGLAKHEGLEGEVDDEIAKTCPRSRQNGILVPVRLTKAERRAWGNGNGRMKRTALDTKTPTTASELVFDRPGELIDMYRNNAMVARAGARILTGLVGNIQFPKKTGAGSVYWVPENPGVDVTATNLTTGLLTLSPKTLMGTESYSRQFLVQAPSSGVDGENLVREDLATGHALAFDFAALHGSGVNGQPLGIYNTPDVLDGTISGVPAYADLINMLGLIGDANAPMDGLKWMTTPLMAAKLATILVASAAGSDFIWKGPFTNGMVGGYPAFATNQVSKTLGAGAVHGIILGLWSEVILATWNSMELIVDPYSVKKQGLIEVTSFQMGDVLVRQPTAFCAATAATIS